jgi:hypothetical protein
VVAATAPLPAIVAAIVPIPAAACIGIKIENAPFGCHPLDAVVRAAVIVDERLGIGKAPGMRRANLRQDAVQRFARECRRTEHQQYGENKKKKPGTHSGF